MIFTYGKWDTFCVKLKQNGWSSRPAREVVADSGNYLVLKHDVETDVGRALKLAQIEHRYGHRGSYYVQAYLLDSSENIHKLSEIQSLGHEVSYHYDVLDSCRGDMDAAILEFEKNRSRFEQAGFEIVTVCQHGNPVMERRGYHSNRDFFRNEQVRARYPQLADIVVDFPEKHKTSFIYFSDAGRKFQRIFDPINNDIINSDDQNVPYEDLDALLSGLSREQGNIISTHPHRWTSSALLYVVKSAVFKIVKAIAKVLMKVPTFKRFMSRFYHLAKKF